MWTERSPPLKNTVHYLPSKPFSHPFILPFWPSFGVINSPVPPPPLCSLPPAAEMWCYLPISPYWSPERAEGAGNQAPQTVLWRKRREWDNRFEDEGNDPLKKHPDSWRWASEIATDPIVSQPPLIKLKNNLDLTIRTVWVSSVADMEKRKWERTKGQEGWTVGIIWWVWLNGAVPGRRRLWISSEADLEDTNTSSSI